MEQPKMGIIEFEPGGVRRYGLDNLHLAHPVSGAILWSELADPSWEGSLGGLLEILSANVEDSVKELPEWPSSPRELHEYLLSLDGYLYSLFGGDVEVGMRDHSEERPEDTQVLIEFAFTDDFGDDDPEGEGEHRTGFEFDFDWIAPEDREER